MISLHTPREVLNEIKSARTAHKPWWADRLADRMLKHLERCLFNGKPVADTPMSETACEAVLEEARKAVRQPGADPLDDILQDMRDDGERKPYVFGAGSGRA